MKHGPGVVYPPLGDIDKDIVSERVGFDATLNSIPVKSCHDSLIWKDDADLNVYYLGEITSTGIVLTYLET